MAKEQPGAGVTDCSEGACNCSKLSVLANHPRSSTAAWKLLVEDQPDQPLAYSTELSVAHIYQVGLAAEGLLDKQEGILGLLSGKWVVTSTSGGREAVQVCRRHYTVKSYFLVVRHRQISLSPCIIGSRMYTTARWEPVGSPQYST